ncbi:MAG TPA: PE domain-containing protein [Mycobacteriales bacterium]
MFRVDPDVLRSSTRALTDVGDVSRALDSSRGEITAQLARAGSDPVSRSAEQFLDTWARGLRDVSARVDRLGGQLHTAATEYEHAEQRLRSHLGAGADGGPA